MVQSQSDASLEAWGTRAEGANLVDEADLPRDIMEFTMNDGIMLEGRTVRMNRNGVTMVVELQGATDVKVADGDGVRVITAMASDTLRYGIHW